MKKNIRIYAVFMILLVGSGTMAQSCYLTINDQDNTNGAYYTLAVQIWDYTNIPYVSLNTELVYNVYFLYSGYSRSVSLSYSLAPDYGRLKFHIFAENNATSKTGDGWSQQTFDSDDYYNNNPPVIISF